MEATVIMAKCHVSDQGFAIRAQEEGNDWYFTWAFMLSDHTASKEGYDDTEISGVVHISSDYPGCPHCADRSFVQCGGCNKISCSGNVVDEMICPHCGTSLKISTADYFDGIAGGAF